MDSEEARIGVSRPTIKKCVMPLFVSYYLSKPPIRYLEDKYKLEITAAVNTNINRAIISGEEKGVFTLPKGQPSRPSSFLLLRFLKPSYYRTFG